MPVMRPSSSARRGACRRWLTATGRGATAIPANAGWPNLGKLSARSAPERSASRKSKRRLAGADVPLDLFFPLDPPRGLVGVVAIGIAANLDAVNGGRTRGRIEHERG